MATRKPKSPPPTPAVTAEDLAWLVGLYVGSQEVFRSHDGKLSPDAAMHLAAEYANSVMKEFLLRKPL